MMARLAQRVIAPPEEDIYNASPEHHLRSHTTASSPGTSDKENRPQRVAGDKGKGREVASAVGMSGLSARAAGKRRRDDHVEVEERTTQRRRMSFEILEDDDVDAEVDGDPEVDNDERPRGIDEDGYDPDQDPHERRKLRNSLRDLHRKVADNRSEYLLGTSKGLADTLRRQNRISNSIKQTADATIDSRLLVTTADLSLRKTVQLTLGNTEQGVDIDQFVSKCISLMKNAVREQEPNGTQSNGTQRRRVTQGAGNSDDEHDDGDMLNWDALGRVAYQYNNRPALAGFLLGPLSFSKRARRLTQRKPGLKISSLKETQPEVLTAADVGKNDNTNLTVLCTRIRTLLRNLQQSASSKVQAEADARPEMTDEEIKNLMWENCVLTTGGIDFVRFVINPYSFGQTIENMFYVSFLIRDGYAKIDFDDDGIPGLEHMDGSAPRDRSVQGVSKHQAVLDIDMKMWRQLIEAFDIKTPMIPHRAEEAPRENGIRGWFN